MTHEPTSIAEADGFLALTIKVSFDTLIVASDHIADVLESFARKLQDDESVKGALIDLQRLQVPAATVQSELLETLARPQDDIQTSNQTLARLSSVLRALECCQKPVVAVCANGAQGVALEIALACHHRIATESPDAKFGHSSIRAGLIPGAGGAQRLLRMLGIQATVDLLLKGREVSSDAALKLGLVDQLTGLEEPHRAARLWMDSQPDASQPWDRKGFAVPGGAGQQNAALAMLFSTLHGTLLGRTQDNYPAQRMLVSTIYEGSTLPMDAALRIDSRYLTELFANPVARNIVRTSLVGKTAADELMNRPQGFDDTRFSKVAVLGAGMMGAGIAYSTAAAGIAVVLLDQSIEFAEKGKAYCSAVVAKSVARGKITESNAADLLDRITPTTDYDHLKNCDLVIEAVFEDVDIKADVTRKAEAVMPQSAVYASNTSTIRISMLAKASQRPQQFIGLHFSSPVDRMPVVEVIVGEETSQETLAKSLDFAAAISKTPIVVNDYWGFYLSRVFGTYPDQGASMLSMGVAPALIENAGKQAGMPVGPLAITDEISLELTLRIQDALEKIAGDEYVRPGSSSVADLLVNKLGRLGRKSGAGFYEYPENEKKFLWPGLEEHFPLLAVQPTVTEVKNCLLYRQSLEAVRCLEENIVMTVADADVCAVIGWNFPAYTGGPLSLIDTVGIDAFVAECQRLAETYGDQFAPPKLLLDMQEEGRCFYPHQQQKELSNE